MNLRALLRLRGLKTLLLFILGLNLLGCTTLRPAADRQMSWEARQASLSQLKNFTVQGAIAIRQGKEAEKASFHLVQQAEVYQLAIYGPLGIGRNVIKGDSKSVTLTNSSGKIFTAKSPEALLEKHTGWNLPLSNLPYWIKGLPAANKQLYSELTFDSYHHIKQLRQQGWKIQYERYAAVQNYDLPTKIRFEQKDLQLVIMVNRWEPE